MASMPWHPRGNAYPVAWALCHGLHGEEYGVVLRIRTGPATFAYELYDYAGNHVGTYPTGSEASEVAWERHLAAHRERHRLAASRAHERPRSENSSA